MSSILDALKKLESEKAESTRSAGRVFQSLPPEQQLTGRKPAQPHSIRPYVLVAFGALGAVLLVTVSVGASLFFTKGAGKPEQVATVPGLAPAPVLEQKPAPEPPPVVEANVETEPARDKPLVEAVAEPAETKPAPQPVAQVSVQPPEIKPPHEVIQQQKPAPVIKEKIGPNPEVGPEPMPVPEPKPKPDPVLEAKPAIKPNHQPEPGARVIPPAQPVPQPNPAPVVQPPVPAAPTVNPPMIVARAAQPPAPVAQPIATTRADRRPVNVSMLPPLRNSDKPRYGLEGVQLNMLRPASKNRPYASAIINLQPIEIGEVIPGSSAVLIAVEKDAVAIEIEDTRERFQIRF
ncbi:MAG TPA: hypothetical protein VMZ06_11800 [Candidatus Bathyarchaeia archaeon]|nr:hypothetical protein [Candidatus Bathyarchaeia archaeon]